jgi:hypothetical protein
MSISSAPAATASRVSCSRTSSELWPGDLPAAARHGLAPAADQRRVDADGGAAGDLRPRRRRADRLGGELANLARCVGALERRQVEHRDREADPLLLGFGLDRALGQRGHALLDRDAVDVGQASGGSHVLQRTARRSARTGLRALVRAG